jgi:hypothetical protein
MSASDEWTDWHLTPRGWERGDRCVDFAGVKEQNPKPEGTVAVYCYREVVSSIYSAVDRSVDGPRLLGTAEAHRDLLDRFGQPPQKF